MKKRRFLKKEYYHAVESLHAKEKFIGERLRKVQLMHERAMTAMTKDRDEDVESVTITVNAKARGAT